MSTMRAAGARTSAGAAARCAGTTSAKAESVIVSGADIDVLASGQTRNFHLELQSVIRITGREGRAREGE